MIKYIILIWISLAFASCTNTTVRIDGQIGDGMGLDSTWIYLIGKYDNQVYFVDSVLIKHNKFHLKGDLVWDETFRELILQDKEYRLKLKQGDRVKIQLTADTKSDPAVIGSRATNEMHELRNFADSISQGFIIPLMKRSFTLSQTDPMYEAVKDSLDYYMKIISKKDLLVCRSTLSPSVAMATASHLIPHLSGEEINVLFENISMRFPNSQIANSPSASAAEPTTSESKRVEARIAEIRNFKKPTYTSKAISEKSEVNQVASYKIGDIVADIALPNRSGTLVSIYEQKTPFVLVDFWASWCSPCRKETPHLIAAEKQYHDMLTVYAISVDEQTEAWQKSVGELAMERFVNVWLAKENDQFQSIIDKFDVKGIPHNFLLDKDRKIIAIDLRGEALTKKMEELAGK